MPHRPHAIVIGVSSGGVEALGLLLPALPARLRAAVLVVLHLPPNRPSLLPSIFANNCALPVKEAEDKEDVQPGVVYFAPPDYHLLVDQGPRLVLSFDPPVHYSRPAIDPLFQSAADVYGRRLWGLVLTGSSGDGADGLLAVQQAGGRCFVQAPDEAASPLMPFAARQRVPGATVMGLKDLAAALAAWPD